MTRAQVAALEVFGATACAPACRPMPPAATTCCWLGAARRLLLRRHRLGARRRLRRPGELSEQMLVYRRDAALRRADRRVALTRLVSRQRAPAAARTREAGSTSVKLEPCPSRAVDQQLAAVALHHMLDDGQAQAGAAGVARTAAVDPVEALGQARQVLGAMPGRCRARRSRPALRAARASAPRPCRLPACSARRC
jgi:hypothetical protein